MVKVKGGVSLFITQLTKRDWYRIYKYLWKARLLPISKTKRFFIKFGAIIRILLALWFLLPITLRALLIFFVPLTLSYFEIALAISMIFIWTCYYPLVFGLEIRNFSPSMIITLRRKTSITKFKKIRAKYPTAYITPKQGILSPPFNSKWIIISFKDCYLLVAKGALPYDRKRYSSLLSVIRYENITDKIIFYKQLDSVCERIIDYSDIKLLHGK